MMTSRKIKRLLRRWEEQDFQRNTTVPGRRREINCQVLFIEDALPKWEAAAKDAAVVGWFAFCSMTTCAVLLALLMYL